MNRRSGRESSARFDRPSKVAPEAARDAFIVSLTDDPQVEPRALHELGLLWHQTGRSEAGVALLQRAVAAEARADWYNDLGNVRADRDELELAAEAFIKALEVDLGGPEYWNNFGAVLQRMNSLDDAIEAFERAVELAPEFIAALNNLGNALSARGDDEAAAEYFCRAYVLGPLNDKPLEMLGIAYYKLGRIEQAAAVYRKWVAQEPENPKAKHMLAACGGESGPARADDTYVKELFDAYAEHFDEKLVDQLGYRGPQMIEQVLTQVAAPERQWRVLDGGCGTGLCGPVVAPYAAHLVGVDLSPNMLAKARQRGCYDACEEAEITTFLRHHTQSFDLIVLGDCMIYFGDVSALFAAASAALAPRGLFIFTHEVLNDPERENGWRLNPSGRYSHTIDSIRDSLAENGFELIGLHQERIRKEFGEPVEGAILTARAHRS